MIHVREATFEDIPWILGELKKFATFMGTERTLFPTEEYATEKLKEVIESHVFCIAESYNKEMTLASSVGFIAGICGPHFFNPEIITLSELFWWVTPEWRNTRAGALLFSEFMHSGRVRANMIVMTLEEQSPVHEETLTRHGFKRYERNYVLEVK
jgi:N-acetylglutamate synthase-like GNAT family acetyltransferase